MSTPVCNIEQPYNSGKATSLTDFNPGSQIGIMMKGDAQYSNGQYQITIEWSDAGISPYLHSGWLDLLGNANVGPITLPETATQGTITISFTGLLVNSSATLDIGVGTVATVTKPPASTANSLETDLKWVGYGAVGLTLIWLLSQLLPGIIKGTSKSAAEIASKKKS